MAAVCALALAACNYETSVLGPGLEPKALKPLPAELTSLIEQKNMGGRTPILVRIFKEEAELEVWKQTVAGDYELLKTYPICRWSGELGPKIREGDRQAPEGFYQISPGLMNPRSSFYLAFNLGYPNAFDRAHNRTGAHLMVHGDCSSRGCYSMTDEQIGEIFALAREAFEGGQQNFQVQAYPFRMTPQNLAKHRNSPHLAFWRMLKEGNDHFLVTKQEPKVDVCGRRYVFNAIPFDPGRPLDAQRACPPLDQAFDVLQAVAQKKETDDRDYASLVASNVATVPVITGRDGGMHPVFAAAIEKKRGPTDDNIRLATAGPLPGTIPATVRPPVDEPEGPSVITASTPPPAPKQATAQPTSGILAFASRWFANTEARQAPSTAPAPAPKPRPATAPASPKKSDVARKEETDKEKAKPAAALPGAVPVLSTGSFN